MAIENETIAEIIAEMRSDANADDYTPDGILGQTLNCLADRLEAAHKRECEKMLSCGTRSTKEAARIIMRNGAVNAAKFYEAQLSIKADILKRRSENVWYITDSDILEKIDAALAAPARICDVLGEEAMINIVKSEIGKHVPMATDHERKIAEMAATAALATAYATVSIKESEAAK